MNETNNTIAYRLRQARKAKKLTQDELAELCGISRQTIFEYEKGIYIPKLDNAGKLSLALGISLDYICFGIPSDSNYSQTYKNLMTSFLHLCNAKIFDIKVSDNLISISTTDPNFISFYIKLNNVFSLEDSLTVETYNKSLNDLLSSFDYSIK